MTAVRSRKFGAAPGAGFTDIQADKFGKYLERRLGLGQRPVAPEEIVEAARSTRSPIHGVFTWNDTEAAGRWRLQEARHLVNHIVITVEVDGSQRETRAFHSVKYQSDEDKNQVGYVSEKVVWQRPDFREQVVAAAFRELRSWKERYSTYSFLSGAISKVNAVLDEERLAS